MSLLCCVIGIGRRMLTPPFSEKSLNQEEGHRSSFSSMRAYEKRATSVLTGAPAPHQDNFFHDNLGKFSAALGTKLELEHGTKLELEHGGMPANVEIGSHVWVEDPEVAWIDGIVINIEQDEVEVQTSDGKTVAVSSSRIYPNDVEALSGGVDDMTRLQYLHEPAVLHNLATRYEINEIYTYSGNILIAVNPFQPLSHLYDVYVMERYKGARIEGLSPHVFTIADVAYREMIKEGRSNSILVSGESGAGKTETTKMLMRYLAYLGGHSGAEGRTVEQQVLEEIEKYKLGNPKSFHYLNQSNCYELVGVSDAQEYITTRRAMDVVGINEKEQDAIFRVVAAILHLGNINFEKDEDIDSAVVKDEQSLFHLQMTAELLMCDPLSLEDALCKRVMITPEEIIKRSLDPHAAAVSRDGLAKTIYSCLFEWLVDKINVSIGQDPNSKCLIGILDIYGFESFKANRTGGPESQLIKIVENLISYFVIEQTAIGNLELLPATTKKLGSPSTFEHFEQFCINFTNEKLQQHFNQHVFKMEQEEYAKEEINWNYVEFVDNQDVLDLIEKGVLEVIRIKCAGYPAHRTFSEFLIRFGILAPEIFKGNYEEKVACKWILEKMELKGYLMGKTKLFLRAEQMAELDAKKARLLRNSATVIQRHFRTYTTSKDYIVLRKSSIHIQSHWRGRLARELYKYKRKEVAAVKIQKNLRRQLARRAYTDIRISALVLQTGFRAMAARKDFRYREQTKAATIIQTCWRCHRAVSYYKKLKKASVISQSRWRGRTVKNSEAAIIIQAYWRCYRAVSYYKKLKKASAISQCTWRRTAGKEHSNVKMEHLVPLDWLKSEAIPSLDHGLPTHSSLLFVSHAYSTVDDLLDETVNTIIDLNLRIEKWVTGWINLYLQAIRETGSDEEENYKLEKQVEELRCCFPSEKHPKMDLEETKTQEIDESWFSLQTSQNKVDETNALPPEEHYAALRTIAVHPAVIETSTPISDSKKVENLNAEVKKLKVMISTSELCHLPIFNFTQFKGCCWLKGSIFVFASYCLFTWPFFYVGQALLLSEKQRADNFERTYAEVCKLSEKRRKKLEETEGRVYRLQASLNKMLYSMSDQFAELKMILYASSNSNSTSLPVKIDVQADVAPNNSDASSNDSDFTFPVPDLTSVDFSSPDPNAFQLIVQDLSTTEISGSDNGDKEGAFDDFF
ncbi:hypothetical protein Peur_009976 [Populus x canadensis]